MEATIIQKALILQKRMYNQVSETLDLTRQLAEASDSNDKVVVQMMLSMREEPIEKMRTARRELEELRDSLEPSEGRRLAALLNGAAAETEEEKRLADQTASTKKKLDQLIELDRAVSRKLGRDQSFYK